MTPRLKESILMYPLLPSLRSTHSNIKSLFSCSSCKVKRHKSLTIQTRPSTCVCKYVSVDSCSTVANWWRQASSRVKECRKCVISLLAAPSPNCLERSVSSCIVRPVYTWKFNTPESTSTSTPPSYLSRPQTPSEDFSSYSTRFWSVRSYCGLFSQNPILLERPWSSRSIWFD